ncbi:MAG TPA: FGGY family carbohydrate kinase [Hanamia sp.]|nr:FGGY family carbohydrate kinase [Hanamia sp.]
MKEVPVIAIFDIGKTNKKLLLFDEQYNVVYELSTQLAETKDEDGDPCEDVQALTHWVLEQFKIFCNDKRFLVKAVNVSAYGASFVYLDENGKVLTPLYNYLKKFPAQLLYKFFEDHGPQELISKETASPVMGNLNSGLQLYRIKYEKPDIFQKITTALHLPQYLSYVLGGNKHSEITSIGCHTLLWNFIDNHYHLWVHEEGIDRLFPKKNATDSIAGYSYANAIAGAGIHDSSAALIPYLFSFKEPFILLSTGTWNISLNPFNDNPLTDEELRHNCLCYLSYKGKPVKASRLFAGYEHEAEIEKLALHFQKERENFKSIKFDSALIERIKIPFENDYISNCKTYEEAYHCFMFHLVMKQVESINPVLKNSNVKSIYVDGGFSQNEIFMQMLANEFPNLLISAATVPHASALGAALCLHNHWNKNNLPLNLVTLKKYLPLKQ